MNEKTQSLIDQLLKRWDDARSLQNRDAGKRDDWDKSFKTVNGGFSWNNSSLVLLADFVEGGSYEEYGSIVGLSKDGKIMWEYQSHCSCDGFYDSTACDGELNKEILEKKTFELEKIPVDWEEKIQDSIEILLKAL